MDMLLKLAIVVLVGCLAGRLAKTFKLSNIFGFVIAGIVLGPSCLKLLTNQDLPFLKIVVEIAVAILAFKIGSEFVVRDMKKLGAPFVIITFAEVAGAVVLVFCAMFFLFKQDFVFSLMMASLAAATAPVATIMVMRQYRSDGPVTRMLLPVSALDGVLGVVLFSVAISIARTFAPGADVGAWQVLARPLLEIAGGLVLGVLLGLALTFLGQKAGDSDELLVITLGMILAATGLAKSLALSPLLANIMMGTVLVNLTQNSNRVFFGLNHFTPPVYLLLFTIAGSSFDLGVLWNAAFLVVGYILARAAGKFAGVWLGSRGIRAEAAVGKYLGATLLPQGGLSIALAVLARHHLPDSSAVVIAIIIVSGLLYEIIGPIIAKTAIQRAGEIRGMGSTIR
jgi:Kef-type K+ transport system membrane component KefB